MNGEQYQALHEYARKLSLGRNAVYNQEGADAAALWLAEKIGFDLEALLTFANDALQKRMSSAPCEVTDELQEWLAPYSLQLLSVGIGFGRQANFGIGAAHVRDKTHDPPQQPGALPGNQLVGKRELAQVRELDDFDLTMLISEIHDHGWQVASHTLSLMAGRIEP
jgi:hypothetical protein